jgi:U3 small nucleolar RNA-associated protein 24
MGRRIKAQKVFGAGGVKRVLPPQEAKAKASAAVPAQKRQREASQQAQPRKKKGKHGDADDDDASPEETPVNHVTQTPSALFFQYNAALGPPYQVIVDTNFINFSIKCKIDIYKGMLDCLYARCVPCISDCVLAELEKLGERYRVALRLAKDSRFERLPCLHSGTYADDCICQRVQQVCLLSDTDLTVLFGI